MIYNLLFIIFNFWFIIHNLKFSTESCNKVEIQPIIWFQPTCPQIHNWATSQIIYNWHIFCALRSFKSMSSNSIERMVTWQISCFIEQGFRFRVKNIVITAASCHDWLLRTSLNWSFYGMHKGTLQKLLSGFCPLRGFPPPPSNP